MKVYKTEAVVLKRVNFGEADRILTVFSKERGKLRVLAKGVRKVTSKKAPHIEVFNQVKLNLYKGKNFEILTEAESLKSFERIRGDLKRVISAYYVCELVESVSREEQRSLEVYNLLLDFLTGLDLTGEEKSLNLRLSQFGEKLVRILGFWPKDKDFQGDVMRFIEDLIEREIRSKRLARRLRFD